MKQLQSILNDLDNKEITKHQAYSLILILFDVSESASDAFDRGFSAGYDAGVKVMKA